MGLAVFFPRLAWTVFDTYVLGHPDGKFGALGGIQFAALLMGIAAAVAGLTAVVVVAISVFARGSEKPFPHVRTALVAGLVLSFASFWIPDLFSYGVGYTVFGETDMVIVNWAVVCAIILLAVRAAAGRLPPNSAVESDASVPALRASARAPHRER
jgi:hypothetical protein